MQFILNIDSVTDERVMVIMITILNIAIFISNQVALLWMDLFDSHFWLTWDYAIFMVAIFQVLIKSHF